MAIVQYKNFSYLKGPAGERGLKGDKGDRGPKGDQGPIGLTGPAGNINYSEIRSLLSGTGPITYNSASGVIGFNSTGFATETYVNNTFNNLIGNSPQALNTLNELAAALNNDANFSATVVTNLAGKLALAGGTMTGALILDADPITNLGAATKQYVDQATSSIVTSYNDLTDRPDLFSGSYNDLTNKPTLFSGSYNDLTNKPTLFSGSYNDLSNKPTIPVVPITLSSFSNDSGYITNSALSGYATESWVQSQGYGSNSFSGSYDDLTNKPTIPSDINQLDDVDGLLNSGGGSGSSNWSDIRFNGGDFEDVLDDYNNSEYILSGNEIDYPTIVAAPLTSNSPGETGQIAYDNDYVYVCIATNTWKRSPLTSW